MSARTTAGIHSLRGEQRYSDVERGWAAIQEAYVQGVSTRPVDELVKAMGMTGISKSQVSRLCGEIDGRISAFLERPLEGDWPDVWLDATYVTARRDGRIVSVAVIIAVGVNSDGRREVPGLAIGASESPWRHRMASTTAPRSARSVARGRHLRRDDRPFFVRRIAGISKLVSPILRLSGFSPRHLVSPCLDGN